MTAALIVAAVNALPDLLRVVEAAQAAMHLRNEGDPHGQMGRTFDQLTEALKTFKKGTPT